ncbi:MAG: bifunctional phosphoribosylaminoimidazolecarboxamide formyltransferase/IMP cyclohydrolase, partial [Candidatus Margulisiibacteriota bacterium]
MGKKRKVIGKVKSKSKLPTKHYALVSVSDKAGLVPFIKELKKLNFEIVSSGGTAKFLKKAGVKVTEVVRITKYPHILGGRVKTLHPLIHGGILADPAIEEHQKDIKKFKIRPFKIVVCNLYPFEEVISRKEFTHEEAIENIDIGGPAMVRGAAKNYKNVAVVVDPADYPKILEELKQRGEIAPETREHLALKAFKHTAHYDHLVVHYLSLRLGGVEAFPKEMEILLEKVKDLRYGENPHQKASLYREQAVFGPGRITEAKQLHGKELSFNNYLDMEAAWSIANYFAEPTVAIVKHNNPCGVAKGENLVSAYQKALACDPVSAFGGIVAANRRVDEVTAKEISKLFVEVVIAPSYTPMALDLLK